MRIEQPHPLLCLVDGRTLAQVLLSSFPNKKSIAYHKSNYSGPSLIRRAWDQRPFRLVKAMNIIMWL